MAMTNPFELSQPKAGCREAALIQKNRNMEGIKDTRWAKGQSGNPGGRPKGWKRLQELCRENTETALRALVEVASDGNANSGARVAAACALLDRGYGRPVQQLRVEQEVDIPKMHLEALKALNETARERNPTEGRAGNVIDVQPTRLQGPDETEC